MADDVDPETSTDAEGQDDDRSGAIPLGDSDVSRRDVLAGGGLAALGVGAGALLMSGGNSGKKGKNAAGRYPFSLWEKVRAGLRDSPDHLPGTAQSLVEEGDPETLYEFVRDDIATQPPHRATNEPFASSIIGGPRGALRSGMATPREKAELLATLLDRAGYDAAVRAYQRPLDTERVRDLYFDGPSHEYDPGFTDKQLDKWTKESDSGSESVSKTSAVDENGDESTALADRVKNGLPDEATLESRSFDWSTGLGTVPVVEFSAEASGETSTTTGTPSTTETPTTAGTPSTTGTPSGSDAPSGETRYADLFHADESFGTLSEPSKVEPAPDPQTQEVTVRLEAATMDDPGNRMELVSGTWKTQELAGRQLQVETLPGISPLDAPSIRHTDVKRFVPALTVQDPHADQETLEELSVMSDPVSRLGDTYTVEDDGTIKRNGTVIYQGSDGGSDSSPTQGPSKAVENVQNLTVETDVSGYPRIKLRADPTDADGNTVEGLSSRAFEVTEAGEQVAATLESNDTGLTVGVYYDNSISMELVGFYEDERSEFREKVRSSVESIGEDISLEYTRVKSDAWKYMSQAATGTDDIIVYMSDGHGYTSGEGTPEQETAISEGPPAIMLSITGKRYDTTERMAELSGGTHIASNDQQSLRKTLTEQIDKLRTEARPYSLTYRTPEQGDPGETRTVTVDVATTDVSAEATYEIPEAAMDPRSKRAFSGLYLTVETAGWWFQKTKSERTLAGWDPRIRATDQPTEEDVDEVAAMLFGTTVLSFESAGVPASVALDDALTGTLSVEKLHNAAQAGNGEQFDEALSDGVGVVCQPPQQLQYPLPDRTTKDSLTYGTGLRTVMFQRWMPFGTSKIKRSVDILGTAPIRTLTRDDDRAREFDLTMDRTARYGVLEREIYGTSTASLLADATLQPVGAGTDHWSSETKTRYNAAVEKRSSTNDDYHIVASSTDTAAHWSVDKQTGSMLGVLPDGSGGSEGVQRIKRQLKKIKALTYRMGLIVDAAPVPGGTALGVTVAYYRLLAQLYALASIAITTMTAQDLNAKAKEAIKNAACTLVVGMGFESIPILSTAATVNDIKGATTGSAYGCGSV